MDATQHEILLKSPAELQRRIRAKATGVGLHHSLDALSEPKAKSASVVLFVLSQCHGTHVNGSGEPCLILNKRSTQVRQAGDLCCPGGGVSWRKDRLFGRLLSLPGWPLWRWSERKRGLSGGNPLNRTLPILLAAGLREAWEEMRLNPLRFSFLGVLPEQHLVMFDRVIYPIVGWVGHQRFKPNWEVARIVPIALRKLLDPDNYGRFRPMVAPADTADAHPLRYDAFPCFVHEDDEGKEMLWGATYRIAQNFLQLVFEFSSPDTDQLPVAQRYLDESYLNGSRWQPRAAKRKHDADW